MNDAFDFETTIAPDVGNTLLVNRYRPLRQLGHGGMGTVWLAEDTKLDGHKVALKTLPAVLIANRRAFKQVKQEALVALKLSHPNIATVRAFEEEGGNPFLVMDYVDGVTLDDYLADHEKLSCEETTRILAPVADALDYAHRQGVVHRDVKPANVIIAKDGTPYVLDFGIAREIQDTLTRVTGQLSSGTLLYMSPEQLRGDAPTPMQDIYSFAVTVYECLSGAPPFSRGGIEDQIKSKTPEPLPPNIAIANAVMAGLAKHPNDRPTCCADLFKHNGTTNVGDKHDDTTSGDGHYTKIVTPGKIILAILITIVAVTFALLFSVLMSEIGITNNDKYSIGHKHECPVNEEYAKRTCLANRLILDRATEAYIINENLANGSEVTLSMLAPESETNGDVSGKYLLNRKPKCPAGGEYKYLPSTHLWRCTVHNH